MKAYHLINVDELMRFRLDQPQVDDLELMARLNVVLVEQLHQMEVQRCMAIAKGVEPLKCYTSLHPTQQQLRSALLRLWQMPCPDNNGKRLMWQKQHWIAIMRVFQFLQLTDTRYGARQRFTELVNQLLEGAIPPIKAADLKNIEAEKPFNHPLHDWYGRISYNKRMSYCWNIAITFLRCISDENMENFMEK